MKKILIVLFLLLISNVGFSAEWTRAGELNDEGDVLFYDKNSIVMYLNPETSCTVWTRTDNSQKTAMAIAKQHKCSQPVTQVFELYNFPIRKYRMARSLVIIGLGASGEVLFKDEQKPDFTKITLQTLGYFLVYDDTIDELLRQLEAKTAKVEDNL